MLGSIERACSSRGRTSRAAITGLPSPCPPSRFDAAFNTHQRHDTDPAPFDGDQHTGANDTVVADCQRFVKAGGSNRAGETDLHRTMAHHAGIAPPLGVVHGAGRDLPPSTVVTVHPCSRIVDALQCHPTVLRHAFAVGRRSYFRPIWCMPAASIAPTHAADDELAARWAELPTYEYDNGDVQVHYYCVSIRR